MITLKATLATGSEALRAELETLTDHKLILACAALEGPTPLPPVRRGAPAVVVPGDPDVAMRHVLSSMAKRWLALHEEAKAHAASLKALTAAAAPQLVEAVGVGYDTAAQMLITAGDNANRQANAALYRVVIVRMRWHQPTIDYVARRTAEGMSKREIIRCLKRYLARELFRLLPAPDAIAKPVNGELEIAA